MGKFKIEFVDKNNKITKSFNITTQDETTAWQWADKQKEFIKSGKWKIKVTNLGLA